MIFLLFADIGYSELVDVLEPDYLYEYGEGQSARLEVYYDDYMLCLELDETGKTYYFYLDSSYNIDNPYSEAAIGAGEYLYDVPQQNEAISADGVILAVGSTVYIQHSVFGVSVDWYRGSVMSIDSAGLC